MHVKLIALSALVLPLGGKLSTDYSANRSLRIETETAFSMETTESRVEVDGEQQDRGFGGMRSEETRKTVTLDTVMEASEGSPTRVQRVFETIESSGTRAFGENEMEIEHDTPLRGLTLEITEEGVEVLEGDEPDDESILEGHAMVLALDALLPTEDVEVGESWTIDGEQVMTALSLNLESAFFVRPEREPRGEGEGRGGRGGRRGPGRRSGGSPAQMFAEGVWTASATLVSMDEESESGLCAKITLELSCTGEMPEPEFGGGRRGGRSFSPRSGLGESVRLVENSFEIELEGELHFLLEDRIPVFLEVAGSLSADRTMERSTERGDFFMYTAQEGSFKHTARISKVEKSAEDQD